MLKRTSHLPYMPKRYDNICLYVKYTNYLCVLILIIFLENGQQLYYDPSKEWCNWRDQVDCDVRPECDENDQNCKDPHHTTTPKPTKCDTIGKSNKKRRNNWIWNIFRQFSECDHGDDFYPEGPCEQCFCQCHSGVQDEVCCPPGLVFNTALNICDYPANTNGC